MSVFPLIFHSPEFSVHGEDEKREEDGAENNLGGLQEKAIFCISQLVGSLNFPKGHIIEAQVKTIKVVVAKRPAAKHLPPTAPTTAHF
jgi:hypothetical protein